MVSVADFLAETARVATDGDFHTQSLASVHLHGGRGRPLEDRGGSEGVSAAFIRELLRKAALFAADDTAEGVVEDRHLDAALHELVVQGGDLTRSLLGVRAGT